MKLLLCAIIVFAVPVSLSAGELEAEAFQIIDYPGGYNTSVSDVNDSETMVGFWDSDPDTTDYNADIHGFVYDGTTFNSIDIPGASLTRALGINDAGHIVGDYRIEETGSDGTAYNLRKGFLIKDLAAFLADPTQFTELTWQLIDPTVPSPIIGATDVNTGDTVVGFYLYTTDYAGFRYQDGGDAQLKIIWDESLELTGITDSGVITGTSSPYFGRNFGVIFTGGSLSVQRDLVVPESVSGHYLSELSTSILGVNDAGDVVGYFLAPSNNTGFVYHSGAWGVVRHPSAIHTWLRGINDNGMMVGNYIDSSNIFHGFSAKLKKRLIGNPDGTVTDLDQCLTWTRDAILPCNYPNPGSNCWFSSLTSAENWANNLTFASQNDWRLSKQLASASRSELEHVFYNILGNPPGGPIRYTGPFENVLAASDFSYVDGEGNPVTVSRSHDEYWISVAPGTPVGQEPTFKLNEQTYADHFMVDGGRYSAWAVREGCTVPPRVCEDSKDNDGDGLIDMVDPGCETLGDNDESGALRDNGDGTISDVDVCLMWPRDGYAAQRTFSWDHAVDYVDSANAQLFLGYSDWRLPDARNFDGTGPCTSLSGLDQQCSNSELGHLYYTELGKPGGGPLGNTDPFENIQRGPYWTGTDSSLGWAYEFNFMIGSQSLANKNDTYPVMLVRDLVDPSLNCPDPKKSQCNNGVDDDGDGNIDYPADAGCCSKEDNSEGRWVAVGSKFTVSMAKAKRGKIGHYIKKFPKDAQRARISILEWLNCRNILEHIVPGIDEIEGKICLEGPITTGAPMECPPLNCQFDQPPCMNPEKLWRVRVPELAIHEWSKWVEGKLSDRKFISLMKKLVKKKQIQIVPNKAKRWDKSKAIKREHPFTR